MSARLLNVFLCHASEDKPIVRELYNKLSATGWLDVWLDEVKLLPGQEWEPEIEKAVKQADVVVVFLSKRSVAKEGYIQKELRFVLDIAKEKPEGTIFVIPFRLDECSVPGRLHSWQYVDYFPRSSRNYAYHRLLESLRTRAEKLDISTTPSEKPGDAKPASPPPAGRPAPSERITSPKAAGKPSAPKAKKSTRKYLMIAAAVIALVLIGFAGVNIINSFGGAATPVTTQPAVNLEIGSTQISPVDNMTLLYVPAGPFKMGSDDNADELPVTSVDLQAFWIDKTEVTNTMYAACVQAGKCGLPSETKHFNDVKYAYHPVTYVTWYDAKNYCQFAGRRLPTEAEWEKAARGPDKRTYPWGNSAPNTSLLNYNKNIGNTKVVGSYPGGQSPYLAWDMAGNVWEWVSSLYIPYPYNAKDGREDPASSQARVARGGSWSDPANFVRAADRFKYTPSTSLGYLGFRCVLSE